MDRLFSVRNLLLSLTILFHLVAQLTPIFSSSGSCSNSDGIYTLSTRSLLELRNYLQNEFGEEHYHTCTHCKDLITLGIGCSNTRAGCTTRYHYHCARNTIASAVDDDDALHRLAGFSCPNCLRTWKSRPIGPRALNLSTGGGGDDGMFSSQGEASQEVARRSGRRRVSEVDEEDDDDDDDDDDEVEQQSAEQQEAESDEEQQQQPTQSRLTRVKPEPDHQRTPTQRRPSRRAAPADEDDDDFDEELDVKPRKRVR